jgi:Na+-driven multidrug efflux pump
MSIFVFLVYFSMPLGTAIMASGRQKSWALVQCIGVTMSLVLDPILIPALQTRMGNGGLGPCLAITMSEMMVVTWGAILAPKGLFDRQLLKSLLLAILAGVAMIGVAFVTKPISSFLAVPSALLTYAAFAWVSGAIQPSTIDMIKGFVARKLSRAR